MKKGKVDAPTEKGLEDLQEAKATILLNQKQINSYEKLIKKQNNKIQTLRQFIVNHHGKNILKTLESCKSAEPAPSTSSTKKPARVYSATTCTRITPNFNDTNAIERKHLDNDHKETSTNSCNKRIKSELNNNNGDKMISIRLGVDDMRSFFSSQPDVDRPLIKPEPQSPSQWETITSSLSMNRNPQVSPSPSSQTTADSSPASQALRISPHSTEFDSPPLMPNKTSIAVSPFSDGHHIRSKITSSTTKNEQKLSLSRNNNKRRLPKDTIWETLSSPSPPELDLLHHHQATTKIAISRSMQPNTSQKHPPNKRNVLNTVCQNQSTEAKNKMSALDNDQKKIRNQIIKRPAPNSEFHYEEVVRKKDERAKLHGSTCTCCEKYFESNGNPTTTHEHIQRFSRHRERYARPKTPPGYWDLDFPPSPQK